MEQRKRMEAGCAKAALWMGIVFWLVALSLALRLVYTGYAALVPAQRYSVEPMADGGWYIAIEASPVAFSAVADSSLVPSHEEPANPKTLHLILLGADLLVHAAAAYVLFLLRRMFSEISGLRRRYPPHGVYGHGGVRPAAPSEGDAGRYPMPGAPILFGRRYGGGHPGWRPAGGAFPDCGLWGPAAAGKRRNAVRRRLWRLFCGWTG